jgi:hypothetical protein
MVDLNKILTGRVAPNALELFNSILNVAEEYRQASDELRECVEFKVINPSYVML